MHLTPLAFTLLDLLVTGAPSLRDVLGEQVENRILTPGTALGLVVSDADRDVYARERGGRLFLLTTRLLGGTASEDVRRAGEQWA